MVRISNLDLVKILKKNARSSYSAIAKKLGVSETAVRKRIALLEKEGVIIGYRCEVDFRKLGFGVHALIGLDSKPEEYFSVIEKLKKDKNIESLYTSSGDHMLMIEVYFQNSEKMAEFLKKLEEVEGVSKVCPAIILERIK